MGPHLFISVSAPDTQWVLANVYLMKDRQEGKKGKGEGKEEEKESLG